MNISLLDLDEWDEDDFFGMRDYLINSLKRGRGEVMLRKPTALEKRISENMKKNRKM